MPKDHLNDQLIDVENNEEIIIERNNQCCNNKNVCIMLSTSLCIVVLISGLTLQELLQLNADPQLHFWSQKCRF